MTPLEHWPTFMSRVHSRLLAGHREYGDASLDRPAAELLDEMRQELEDVCGWAVVLSAKIERLQRRLEQQES